MIRLPECIIISKPVQGRRHIEVICEDHGLVEDITSFLVIPKERINKVWADHLEKHHSK
jgi:hypothetical protein